MGNRWGAVGGAVRARLRRWIVAGVAAVLAAVVAAGPAGAEPRALEHHAVVLNGALVGSAFLIAADLAVTNRHVVRGLRPGSRVTLLASGPGGGSAEGRLLAVSPRMDLALIEVPAGFMPPVAATDAALGAGLAVTAAGIDAGEGSGGERLALSGMVLDPSEELEAFGPGLIAWLPGARPGFSGGPLLDEDGRLAGVVTALRPAESAAAMAIAGGAGGPRAAVEAFALRAADVRAEVRRLLAAEGR